MISHTAQLPYGIAVTFRWTSDQHLTTEWSPDIPCIKQPRARRRFLAAYQEARNTFLTDVATTLGGAVVVADLTGEIAVIAPATKQ